MKNTKQKEEILAAVLSMKYHPTAEEIYTELRKTNKKISLGTVYRNLNSFANQHKIKKVRVPVFGDRYDFRVDDHEHIFCEKCGKVFDYKVEISVPQNDDFIVTSHMFLLFGICKNCQI